MGVTANSTRWQKLWRRDCWISTVACCHCMFCKMLIAFIGRTPIPSLRENVALMSFRCGGCICKVISSLESPPYSCKQRACIPKLCGVHRHFLSDPHMTWFYFISLVTNFSCIVAEPTATSFVRIAKLFHKIVITVTKVIFVSKL